MLPEPCYIISDVHLGAAPQGTERMLLDFLASIRGRAASLVINGDLFDFYFEWRHVIPSGSFRTLAAMAELREAGTTILMLGGNHDSWGGDVLRTQVGVDYRVEPWEGNIAGWHARVEHGDGLRPEADRWYRVVRSVLRNRWSIRAFRLIHPDLGSRLAMRSSMASRDRRGRHAREGRELRDIAVSRLATDAGLELIVYGHSHTPHLEAVAGPRTKVYANAGSWLEVPTFLIVTSRSVELREWRGGRAGVSAEGYRLNVVDRAAEETAPQ